MFDRIQRGEVALGTITLTSSPEWVEIMGHLGMDFTIIDMMITTVDWGDAGHLIRAANRFNMTPWLRLEAYPWGKDDFDARTAGDVLRALSIGAEVLLISLNTPDEVAAAVQPSSNWHRRVYLERGEMGNEQLRELRERLARETLVMPLIESRTAFENLEEIVEVKGLRAVFLGMGDLSREMGHAGDPRHPEMRGYIKQAVEIGKRHDVMVMANTGHVEAPQDILETTKWLWDTGIPVVWLPYFEYILQTYYRRTMDLLRKEIPARKAKSSR